MGYSSVYYTYKVREYVILFLIHFDYCLWLASEVVNNNQFSVKSQIWTESIFFYFLSFSSKPSLARSGP